jgi:hypothetical protein
MLGSGDLLPTVFVLQMAGTAVNLRTTVDAVGVNQLQ